MEIRYSDLNGEENVTTYHKKELQNASQIEFRIQN